MPDLTLTERIGFSISFVLISILLVITPEGWIALAIRLSFAILTVLFVWNYCWRPSEERVINYIRENWLKREDDDERNETSTES